MAHEVEGRPAFVSGGSRGIGAAVARRLARCGARVVIGYRQQSESAAAVAREISSAGGEAMCVGLDVADERSVDRAFTEVEERWGTVSVLVNNAGIHIGSRVESLGLDAWNDVMSTNLTGAFLCARRAVPGMTAEGWGRIVTVGSVVGLNGYPGDVAYASAKAGLVGLTRALALELARCGVTANLVAPGFIDTDMTQGLGARTLERLDRTIPARRRGTGDDVADAVEYLVTGGGYVTGAVLAVDGGWLIG